MLTQALKGVFSLKMARLSGNGLVSTVTFTTFAAHVNYANDE